MSKILIDETIKSALDQPNAVLAFGVSGGKDSDTLCFDTIDYVKQTLKYDGKIVMIHSDLGLIEHTDSLPTCERLSRRLNIPLIVVKPNRPMIERWKYRWQCNVERFVNLKTVKIATPFSSALWRFCTSEEKIAPICQNLKKTFPGSVIINAIGIRGEESKSRALKPISKANKFLRSVTHDTIGYDWHPIRDHRLEDVFLSHRKNNFRLHEAYTKNGNSRVSCAYCVLAGNDDLRASMKDERTHPAFHQIVELETNSTFSFKPDTFLSDVGKHLLNDVERENLEDAKNRAVARRLAERLIPQELLFDSRSGFPKFQPNIIQSEKLAEARSKIGESLRLTMRYTTGRAVYDRYAELLEEKRLKDAKKSKKNKSKPIFQGKLF